MRDKCVLCARGAVRMVCACAPQAARAITCEVRVLLARTRAADMCPARSGRERDCARAPARATCATTSARGVCVVRCSQYARLRVARVCGNCVRGCLGFNFQQRFADSALKRSQSLDTAMLKLSFD
eukprot:3885469-Pyramimonas_sp.AAC.1